MYFSLTFFRYFKIIAMVCEICPLRVLALPAKQMQQLLASLELGFYSFGGDVIPFCYDTINILAYCNCKESISDIGRKPKNQMLAPFMNVSF